MKLGVDASGFREIFLFKKLSVICETVKIMGVVIKFEDYEGKGAIELNNSNDLTIMFIEIDTTSYLIEFDIETAVKFSKELRRQIAIAKDNELKSESNGK